MAKGIFTTRTDRPGGLPGRGTRPSPCAATVELLDLCLHQACVELSMNSFWMLNWFVSSRIRCFDAPDCFVYQGFCFNLSYGYLIARFIED